MVYVEYNATIRPRIAALGIGGAGCNIISEMYGALCSVDTIAVNTDKTALMSASADKKIYICKEVTRGEGTHGDLRLGKKCAQVHEEEIRQAVMGHDVVFLIAGLGGGTGTGAVSVIAEICDRMGIMTFCIVIEPFSFEGSRIAPASEGLRSLRAVCPTVIRFHNDRILEQMPDVTISKAMAEVNTCIRKVIMDTVDKLPMFVKDGIDSLEKNVGNKKDQLRIGEISNIKTGAVQYSE